jgi:DHA3 family macrolide efflux protein-like MFS transporter
MNAEPKPHWRASFFTLWTGQALSLIGSQTASFALVWWLTQRTGSGTVLATASMVAMLPGVLLGPFIGALVDRWDRRWIMLIADSVVALFSAWLAYLFWAGALQVWHVYVINFIRALGGAFHYPAMQASTSLMVPEEHLSRVGGMNQTLNGLLTIASPPLGAFLMSLLPLYWIIVITAVFAIAPLAVIRIPPPPRRKASAAGGPSSLWQDVRQGFAYVWHWPGMFLLLSLATLINFLIYPAMALLPLLVTRRFAGGALQLGWLNSAWGVGAIAGGLILSAWGGFSRRIVTSMCGLIGMGLGFLLVGLAPAVAFWLALAAMVLAGAMNAITNGPIFALLQAVVAPDMQGRVFTITLSMAGLAAPLGLAVAGPLSDAIGPGPWFVVGGLSCMIMGAAGFAIPAIMTIEEQRQPAQPATSSPKPGT